MDILASKGKISTLFSSGIVDPEKVKVLRESEERYRSLVESSGFGIATTDFRGRFTFVNEALCKMIGYSRKELIGKHFASFLHSKDKQRILKVFLNAWKHPTEKPSLEFRVVHKKGHVIHMYSTPTLHRRSGKILGFNAIIADITERKQMEESLRESEDRYRSIIELAPDGVVTVDMGGIVTSVNAAFSTISGYSKDEVIGRHFTELGALRANNIPEYLKLFDLTTVGTALPPTEFAYRCKDGTERWGEAHVGFVESGGKRVGLQGILRDITERKKAERIILENQQKFERLFMGNPEAAVYWDSDFRVLAINPRFTVLFGYLLVEIKGKNNVDIIVPKDRAEESAFLGKMSREGYVDYDTARKRKDGSLVHVSLSCAPIMVEGKLVGYVGLYKDITERKRMEDALKESEEKYRSLFENARDVILTADLDGNVTSINKAIEEYGWKREEIIGKNMLELMSKESWPSLLKGISQIVEGRPLEGEIELATPKGKKIAEYKSNPTIRGNKIIGIQVIGRDITERKEMEEKLRDSEEKFRAITVSANDAIVLIDEEGKFSYWNPAAQEMFGYTEEEVGNKKMYELITPKRLQQDHINAFEKFQKVGSDRIIGKTVELPAIRKDGTEFPVEFSLSTLQVKGKGYALGIFRDITDRRKMEESLAESGEKYRRLFESANDALVYGDLAGRILDVNKRAEELAGMKKEDIVGKSFWKLGLVSPKLAPMLLKRLAERLEGEPAKEYELELTRKNGGKMSLEINATIVRRKNVPQGFFAIVRDITEKKSLEEKLKQYSEHLEDLVQKRTEELSESEKRYSVLVEEASDGVMILQDRKIVFANKKAAEIIGYTRDEVNGLPLQKLVDEKYLPLAEKMYERNLRGNAPMTFEVEWRTKNGEHIPIEVSGARIYYKGRPAVLCVARDIRNRKRMEEQRLKLEKLAIIGELATMVAHDLRNPLTSIKNACFYLKSTCPPRDGAECKSVFEMVEILEQETAFANAIINDLLDFAVKRPLERRRKNINNVIKRSLKKANMVENVRIERNFALRPIANVDEEQLERVFLNLIKNSAQAMAEGGRLTIETSETADHVEVVVRDTGTGIAKENMSKIFQPLFTTKAKGIGMGLAICKRIVEEHSGTIDVESEVGKGTAFLIKLPKKVEALAQ